MLVSPSWLAVPCHEQLMYPEEFDRPSGGLMQKGHEDSVVSIVLCLLHLLASQPFTGIEMDTMRMQCDTSRRQKGNGRDAYRIDTGERGERQTI